MALSTGALRLQELVQPAKPPVSRMQLARACNVSPQAVCRWVDGTSRPDPKHRRKLQRLHGIPEDAWDELLRADDEQDVVAPATDAPTSPEAA